ncbi:MAG: S8 family serine peptidase [Caldilineaceae bacterium]
MQQADAPVSVLVVMADQLDLPAALADQPPSTARVAAAYMALTAHAVATQADLRAWLDARGVAYRPYYIANMLQVPADSALVAEIAQRDDVAAIVDNPRIYQTHARAVPALFDGWQPRLGLAPLQPDLLPYGLADTKAVDVWAMGYTGQGVVVASQDTGVEWTHPALQSQYRGWDARTDAADHVYNWFDAWETDGRPPRCADDAQVPCDDDGHGTHTVGTMLGNATPDPRPGGHGPVRHVDRLSQHGARLRHARGLCRLFRVLPGALSPGRRSLHPRPPGVGAPHHQQFLGLPAQRGLRPGHVADRGGKCAHGRHLRGLVRRQQRLLGLQHRGRPHRHLRRAAQRGRTCGLGRHRQLQQPRPRHRGCQRPGQTGSHRWVWPWNRPR